MDRLRATVARNAAFNILRGCAAAFAALALPHFLVRALSPPRFAAWSLMLQIAAYASFLDFGLQTAVARFVAQTLALEQPDRRDRVIETAFVLLSLAAAVAFALMAAVIAAGRLFHGVPAPLLPEFQHAALLLSLGAALSLPLSAFSGLLLGMNRNDVPSLAIGGGRAVGVLLAILAARHTQSLTVLALCVAASSVAGGLIQIPFARRLMPSLRRLQPRLDPALLAELLRYCTGLTAWSLGLLIVSGLDLTIVARFQFSAVGWYAVAASVIALMAGFNSSALNALLAPQAALHARGERSRLAAILRRTTLWNTAFNLLLAAAAALFGHAMLRLWVGEAYAARALPVLVILAAAQTIRLAAAPYCLMLIAAGEQDKGILSGAVEAAVNLAASLWLGSTMGYVGVAWGTLVGTVAGILALLLYTVPRTRRVFTELP